MGANFRRPFYVKLAALFAFAFAGGAHGAVVDAQPGGFEVSQSAIIEAAPGQVWAALGHIGAWWDSRHTFSGDAANLSVDLRPGGCFCERLAGGGGVRHMTVVYLQAPSQLRLSGALGPLQAMGVAGALTWTLKAEGGHTVVSQTYDVGGYARGGLAAIAAPVDEVLSGQLARLKRYTETGKPQ
jgi:uncharacterized protein YndB with AHSA1/START domain